MKVIKPLLISTLLATSATLVIVPPVIFANQVQVDQIQNVDLFDQSGYEDQQSHFKISTYGNLFTKLGFDAKTNYLKVTNQNLKQRLQAIKADQYFEIKLVNGSSQANLINFELNDLKTDQTKPVEITNVNWKLHNPNFNLISYDPIVWDSAAWIKKKLPLALSGNFTNIKPILDLTDAQIKQLITNFSFQSQRALFANDDPNDNLYQYQWNQLNDLQKAQFNFQFKADDGNNLALKVIFNNPKQHDASFSYDPDLDQWTSDAPDNNFQLTNWIINWDQTIAIKAIDEIEKQYDQNEVLTTLFKDHVQFKQPSQNLNFTRSELVYQLDHDFDFVNQNQELQDIVTYDQDWFKQFFPNQAVSFSFALTTYNSDPWLYAPERRYQDVNDHNSINGALIVLGQFKVNEKIYRFRLLNPDNTDNYLDASLFINFDNFIKDPQDPYQYQIGVKPNSPFANKLLSDLRKSNDFLNLAKQWFNAPEGDPNLNQLEAKIRNTGQQLLWITKKEFVLDSTSAIDQFNQNFDFKQGVFEQVVWEPTYEQPEGTLNIYDQVWTLKYQNKMHRIHLKQNWGWEFQEFPGIYGRYWSIWRFDRKQRIIKITLKHYDKWLQSDSKPFNNIEFVINQSDLL